MPLPLLAHAPKRSGARGRGSNRTALSEIERNITAFFRKHVLPSKRRRESAAGGHAPDAPWNSGVDCSLIYLRRFQRRKEAIEMRSPRNIVTSLLAGVVASLLFVSAVSALEVGQKAPDFTLNGTDGKPVKLSDLTAKGPVVLYTFIAAFTGT